MAKEIERKFLVNGSDYKAKAVKVKKICQGYLSRDPDRTVRVRLIDDVHGFLTVKTRNSGATRGEWEYPVPASDARDMLEACTGLVEKTRYVVPEASGLSWEVDEFHGRHEGLVVAELEIPSEDYPFVKAEFIGEEVTGDPKYYNSNL